MTKIKNLMLGILAVSLLMTACTKEVTVNESLVLAEYLESANSPLMKDYVNTDLPSIMLASEVKTLNETGQVYIMDVRAAADFALGHIANAHNVAVADVLTHIKAVDLTAYTKVAVVCYTGQTAGFAASLLRIMGYDKVFTMKWGMCSWTADFAGKWKATVTSGNAFASQFTATETAKNVAGELPVLSTGKTTGQEILEARVATLLIEGFVPASVTTKTVVDNASTYYIVNYWPAAQYAAPGHLPGAVQYEPKVAIKLATDLKTLPTNKPIAIYCYSGQTSAFLSAHLRLLGYDAKSVLYGANGMIYDLMVTNKMTTFNDAQIMGYEYVK
jgi:rhodanese-related sulfurtransferase